MTTTTDPLDRDVPEIRTARISTAPSLSGLSELEYHLGYLASSTDRIYIRLWKNSGNGKFNTDWLTLANGQRNTDHRITRLIVSSRFRHLPYCPSPISPCVRDDLPSRRGFRSPGGKGEGIDHSNTGVRQ